MFIFDPKTNGHVRVNANIFIRSSGKIEVDVDVDADMMVDAKSALGRASLYEGVVVVAPPSRRHRRHRSTTRAKTTTKPPSPTSR